MEQPLQSLDSIERKYYSQNGEDGIIEFLLSYLPSLNHTFVEIGCGTGNENNTTYLVHKGWSGVVFDQKQARIDRYHSLGFDAVKAFALEVAPDNIDNVMEKIPLTPDVFSLDIDGYDYHVMKAMLDRGFKPAIAVLEYNGAFCDLPFTVKYPMIKGLDRSIYFGCGLQAWKRLLKDYQFITVDSSGTNAFFVRKEFSSGIAGVAWLEKVDHSKLEALRQLHLEFVCV